jgi:hypothetical protein
VTCPLKARIVEPEETAVARQWLRKHVFTATKHVTTATNTHATSEELLEAAFSVRSVPTQILLGDNDLPN